MYSRRRFGPLARGLFSTKFCLRSAGAVGRALLGLVLLPVLSSPARAQGGFSFQSLGHLGPNENTQGIAINDCPFELGPQVTGGSMTTGMNFHAFRWTARARDGVPGNPQMRDLGTLGGAQSFGLAIADDSGVAGWSNVPGGGNAIHAMYIPPEQSPVDLGTFGGSNSQANGINNRGEVVGYAENGAGERKAFVWSRSGGLRQLPTLGGAQAEANDINDRGEIVGHAQDSSGAFVACIWRDGSATALPGLGPARRGRAFAINDNGLIVGASEAAVGAFNVVHPVFWRDGNINDLTPGEVINGAARGVNNRGTIVGSLDIRDSVGNLERREAWISRNFNHPVFLSALTSPLSPDLGLNDGLGINDHDEVAGLGTFSPPGANPTGFGYLLFPTQDSRAPAARNMTLDPRLLPEGGGGSTSRWSRKTWSG